jgi:plastocyanin
VRGMWQRVVPPVTLALALPALLSAAADKPEASAAIGGRAMGRLRGTVRLTVAGGTASAATAYARRSVGPRVKAPPEARNVVVSFLDIAPGPRSAAPRIEITQQGEQFVPHVVAIETGTSVEFPKLDAYFHNVFSLSRPGTFDLGRYPTGDSRSRVFAKPGIVKVYCHLHSQMSALIRVFDHSWFTIPDTRGEFVIEEVPAGVHTLVVWHERIGERQEEVTIRPGATTDVSFTLPVLETTE